MLILPLPLSLVLGGGGATSSTYAFMLEPLEYGAKCRHIPAFRVHFVFTAETKVVEPDALAVFVVICETRDAHSDDVTGW